MADWSDGVRLGSRRQAEVASGGGTLGISVAAEEIERRE